MLNSPTSANGANCNILLPVEFLNLRAHTDNGKIKLEWATSNEINSDYFIVQRSTNGNIFDNIGEVDAAGNANSQTMYSFTDNYPANYSTNYYRLKQVDNDGQYIYTKAISVRMSDDKPVMLFDIFGRLVTEKNKQLLPGVYILSDGKHYEKEIKLINK